MTSMKDISAVCGVSVATVSKALSDQSDIGEETKAYVKKTAREMGYLPNASAKALKTKRTFNLGVLFVDEAGNQAVCGFVDSLSRPYTWSWQDLWVCPIAQGPSPVPLDERRLAVLHVPEETARAELELFGELLYEPAGPVEGQDAGDGVWYFEDLDGVRRVEEDGVVQNTDQLDGCAYELKLYGADGGLLRSLEGTIPQTVHRTWLG